MANQYVNKVELADGTSLIDISSDTVTAGSMLNGVTAHDKSGASVTGNIASKSSSDLTASTLTVTAPAGYYASNASKTLSDENLVAGNIKKNVEIFGVTGTYEGGGGGTTTIIVPEQTITASTTYNQITFNAPLVAGEEYKWTINGTTSSGTASDAYGGVRLMGITGTMFEYSSNAMYFDVNGSSYYGTYTLKVWQESGGGGSTLITKTITQNGTYDAEDDNADGYSSVTVNVSGGGGLVYETGTYTPASDVAQPTISFANTHSTRPFSVLIADTSNTIASTDSSYCWYISSWYDAFGSGNYATSSSIRYARPVAEYKTSSSLSNYSASVSSLNGSGSSTSEFAYWVTNTGFKPYSGSASRRWRSGRTYKWIAVWAPSS